jgi:glycine hydroxymethyltransferase
VRIGSAALTARGMKEEEFKRIGEKIADVLDDINNTDLQDKIAEELKEMASHFVMYDKAIY